MTGTEEPCPLGATAGDAPGSVALSVGSAAAPAPATESADVVVRVQGAWRREGLAVGNGAFRELSDVWWLQAGPYFADVRRPRRDRQGDRAMGGNVIVNALHSARAFSGTVDAAGDRLVWRHDLDTMLTGHDQHDAATVLRFADLLLQAGDGYVERWRSAPAGPRPRVFERRVVATGALDARMIEVGDAAVAVWATPASGGAGMRRGADGSLEAELVVGAQPLSAQVATALPGRDELAAVLGTSASPVGSGTGSSQWGEVAW